MCELSAGNKGNQGEVIDLSADTILIPYRRRALPLEIFVDSKYLDSSIEHAPAALEIIKQLAEAESFNQRKNILRGKFSHTAGIWVSQGRKHL